MERALAEQLAQAPVFLRKFSGEILYWTTGAQELYGYDFSSAMGKVSHELFQTIFPEPLETINRALLQHGVWDGLLAHTRADGSQIWSYSRWRLRQTAHVEDAVVVETNADVTQRENLSRELHHRVKNTLTVVQALARLTFRRDAEGVREFEDRLGALAGVHDVLVQHRWDSAGLLEVVERALAGLSVRDRISLSGDDARLKPNSVLAYLLAFHELAVNALKYGALSVPAGRVDISWQIYQDGRLYVVWRELGGPRPATERRPGSGSVLLNRVVAMELGTPVNLRFEETGLVCEFDGPVQKTSALSEVEPPQSTP